jgi:hypothetical protein
MKNDLVVVKMLPAKEHSVKNEEKLNLLWQCRKYGVRILPKNIRWSFCLLALWKEQINFLVSNGMLLPS